MDDYRLKPEVWKPIPGLEGRYSASSYGKILNHKTGAILLGIFDKVYGYNLVYINDGVKGMTKRFSRLICKTFHQNPENKPQVNHKDGIKNHDWADNLEWSTSKENIQHAFDNRLNVAPSAYNSHMSKLSQDQYNDVLVRLENGESQASIARFYGLNQTAIHYIKET